MAEINIFKLLLVVLCVSALTACSQPEPQEKPEVERALSKGESDALLMGIPRKSLTQAARTYMTGTGRSAKDYVEAALKAVKEPDYESAETLATEAIRLDPNNGRAYGLRGRCRCNGISGKDTLAIADLKKAIELGEHSQDSYEYLARLYHDKRLHNETVATLQESLKLNPKQRGVWEFLGAVYAEQGNKPKALECYDKAVECDPDDAQPYFIRAQFLQSMKRYEEAMRDYRTVVKIEPPDEKVPRKGAAYRLLAETLSKLGRHKEAITILTEAISSDQTDDDLLRLRGLEYASMKMYDKAVADYSEAIDMSPDFAKKSYEARSNAYASMGKTELAARDLAEAKRLDDKPAEKPIFELE